jgi:hypothetical protein
VAKLHLAADADTEWIIASMLTGHDADDCGQVGSLLRGVDGPVAFFTADGAYDRDDVHAEIKASHPEAEIIVPPRSSAVPSASAETAVCRPSLSATAGAGRERLATTGVSWSMRMCRAEARHW